MLLYFYWMVFVLFIMEEEKVNKFWELVVNVDFNIDYLRKSGILVC